MSKRWLCLAVLFAIGCRGSGSKVAAPTISEEACESTEGPCPPDCAVDCPAPAKAKCEDIHVHVPRQKVAVPRKAVAGGPAAAGMRGVVTEQQQIMQTRQVMLVPQQVLVPFVQTTVTGPVRVNGLSETQVVNLAATTTTATTAAAGLTATGQTTGTGAAAATQGAAAGAISPQTLTECLNQLRQSEELIRRLNTRAEMLEAEVTRFRAMQQSTVVPVPRVQEVPPPGRESIPVTRVPTPDLPLPRPLPPTPIVETPTIPSVPQATNK